VTNGSLAEDERTAYVQSIFARIAKRYDLMNRLMTAGQDRSWRREVVRRASLPENGLLLDLGAGTGDLAFEAQNQYPGVRVLAADFTLEMMRIGQARQDNHNRSVDWCAADALHLPFPPNRFDAVVSGFLLRNVSDLDLALREQRRVLKTGGRIVILDTTRPARNLLTPFINLHLSFIIPGLGQIITGNREAYTYLPTSTRQFLTAETLAARLNQQGFQEVGFQRLMFSTIALHWGIK
jgi:demethylmenaquinone methyltransferase / 2-methoxy-6-polyprenyl-1,4-benzoquinol methylase